MPTISCSATISTLPGAEWLAEVLHWVPNGIDPWIWLAPDSDDAPAMVGWGVQRRFVASGHRAVECAWHRMASWADDHVVAFGSFPFSKAQEGFLVVPQVLIARQHLGSPTTVTGDVSSLVRRDVHLQPPHIHTGIPAISEAQWTASVQAATRHLREDPELEKVVLARSVDVEADSPVSRSLVASHLA